MIIKSNRLTRLSRIFFILLVAVFVCFLSYIYKIYSFPQSNNFLLDTEDDTNVNNQQLQNFEEYNNTNNLENNVTSSTDADKWIYIDKDIYVYSAYWETRIKPSFVRIIGIGFNRRQDISHVKCALKYNHSSIITTVKSKVITENHGAKHTAMFYFCHTDKMPLMAALFIKDQTKLKWLQVQEIEPNETSNKRLSICVQPLYGNFANNNLQVAEFISYYQLLNVTHFVFYDYKANASVISLLMTLFKSGVSIELLKWNLPDSVKDTWNFGQMAAIVDCMYRQSQSHEYVFIVDLDEFLVPQSNVTLQNLIEGLDNINGATWCSYMFRQSFFCLQQPDNPDFANTSIKLFTLKKITREKEIWNYYARTKSIVRPISVEVPGIHFIWSTIQNSNRIMQVNSNVALLHHYRGGLDDKECSRNMEDKSAVKYGLLLINSMSIQVWERWNNSTDHII